MHPETFTNSAGSFISQNACQEVVDSGTAVAEAIDCGRLLGYELFGIEGIKLAGLQIDDTVLNAEKFVVAIEVVGSNEN